MERADLSGGGVMSEQNDKNAVEENKKPPQKPPGYRKFEKLLKQVVKAPPMVKRVNKSTGTYHEQS
jgi:hypothetical protein